MTDRTDCEPVIGDRNSRIGLNGCGFVNVTARKE
jgi:hypothetical protein